jgi:hypothetical protein
VSAIADPSDPALGHEFDGGECSESMARLTFVVLGTSYTSFFVNMPSCVFTSTTQPNDTIDCTNANPATNPKKKIEGARFTTAGSNPTTVQVRAVNASGVTALYAVTIPGPGAVVTGVLTPTTGRFNYNLSLGIPGADAACGTSYPGTHACELAELESAEASGDLAGIRDAGGAAVRSFWGIDAARGGPRQCWDEVASYTYETAHLAWTGASRSLDNATGTLGAVRDPTLCSESHWVGCCR